MVMMTRLRQFRFWAVAGLLAASALRCGGDNIRVREPFAIAMVGGNEQRGGVGQPLPAPLVVEVTDEAGEPVPNVEVRWAVQGGGSVSSETVETGSNGRASVQRVLGPIPGEQTTTASAGELQGSPVTFVATAVTGGGPGTAIITQPPASALSGEVFAPTEQPVVSVSDVEGNPMPDVEVTATLASGSGTLEGNTTATTNGSGIATFGDLGIRGTGSHTIEFTAGAANATSSSIAISALPSEATSGSWGPVVNWDIVPLHINLLPSGKILAWGRFEQNGMMGQPRLWNPSSSPAGAPLVANDTMLFCAGHALMADGRLMVSGGHKADDRGLDVTNIFDPGTESWNASPLPKMAKGRWYPTVTTLPDGRLVTVAGRDTTASVVAIPEVWDGTKWNQLTGAAKEFPYYPRDFVAPNGQVFYAGERVQSWWLDVNANGGTGRWSAGPSHIWSFNRDYGSAVMYDAGKILYVGGGGDPGWSTPDPRATAPTATAEKIDLNQGGATWQAAGSMAAPRRHLNATVLPDGQVLVTGGVRGGGFNEIGSGVRAAEVWNPGSNGWVTLASSTVNRGYHAVSLLLPDGTVLHGASGDANIPGGGGAFYPAERNHEIFSPPYLFKGVRPTITSKPASVAYGETFSVATPNAAQVTEVRWIRLGSVTHAFDANGRANTLSFTRTAGGVDVDAPDSPNLAPPGHYLLFILNRNGVPSGGEVIRIQ